MKIPRTIGAYDIDWEPVRSQLDGRGFALISGVLAKHTCAEVAGYYADDHRFRSRIEMSRYSFGRGEYKYFNYPLPEIVQKLRDSIYQSLRTSSIVVIAPAKSAQHRYFSNTASVTSTVCIRIYTGTSCFLFKSPVS